MCKTSDPIHPLVFCARRKTLTETEVQCLSVKVDMSLKASDCLRDLLKVSVPWSQILWSGVSFYGILKGLFKLKEMSKSSLERNTSLLEQGVLATLPPPDLTSKGLALISCTLRRAVFCQLRGCGSSCRLIFLQHFCVLHLPTSIGGSAVLEQNCLKLCQGRVRANPHRVKVGSAHSVASFRQIVQESI